MVREKLGKLKTVTAAVLAGVICATTVAPAALNAQAASRGTAKFNNGISMGVSLPTDGSFLLLEFLL